MARCRSRGLICVLLTLPLSVPLSVLGAWIGWKVFDARREIDVWKPGERLAWRALSTPPPMKEVTILRDVDPPHLHGYYRNLRGEFALEQVAPGVTRLTRRTWYSHDLYPSLYWRLWCDYGASKIQRFVLGEVKRAAERGARI